MRRLFSPTSLLTISLALSPACSVSNTDHCGNREGDATCSQQGDAAPYCSICVADNNGCVAAVPEDKCLATTAAATSTSPGSSSTVDPSTTSVPGTTSGTTTAEPTTNPTTEPATTTGLTDTGSTTLPDPTTTTTGDPSTTSGDTSTSTTSGATLDTDTTDTTSTTGDVDTDTDSGGTTEVGPLCGNNMIDGDEVCDGNNNNGETCKTIAPGKWSGGSLSCNGSCESFNDTMCCIGVGLTCNILDDRCCGGLFCNLGTCTVK